MNTNRVQQKGNDEHQHNVAHGVNRALIECSNGGPMNINKKQQRGPNKHQQNVTKGVGLIITNIMQQGAMANINRTQQKGSTSTKRM
jgi:hypothetical protein